MAFRQAGLPAEEWESLTAYILVGLVAGARIGHILFYKLSYYLDRPLEIIKLWHGGLSSHGATVGIVLAIVIWCRRRGRAFSVYADLAVLGIPVTAFFVRLGNFVNSEVLGTPTGGGWGVIFTVRGENFPRHPVQLYEALLLAAVFLVLHRIYRKRGMEKPTSFYLFLFFLLYFGGRCVVEAWKAPLAFPDSFPVTIGQVLSLIPAGLGVIYFSLLIRSGKSKKRNQHT